MEKNKSPRPNPTPRFLQGSETGQKYFLAGQLLIPYTTDERLRRQENQVEGPDE